MRTVLEIKYTTKGSKDNVAYTERHTMSGVENTERAINCGILAFNMHHPTGDRIESITTLKPETVISKLGDIIADYRRGTLIFTEEDLEAVEDAICLLDSMIGGE